MRKVVVTGVAGFIGSHMAERAVAEGLFVYGIDNLWRGSRANLEELLKSPYFKFEEADVRYPSEALDRAFDGAEVVIHYAAINGTQHFYERPLDVMEVNLEGTVNVLRLAAKHRVQKVVFASSSEVYGEALTYPTPENHPIILGDPSNPRYSYAAAKAMAEFYVRWYGEKYGFSWVTLRIFNCYGPRMDTSEYGQVIPEFIRKVLRDEPFTILGNPEHTRSFCFISDHVEQSWRAIEKAENATLNIGKNEEISILELARLLHELVGKPFRYQLLPGRAGDPPRRVPDTRKVEELTGYVPQVSLREGLLRTIEWYKARLGGAR